MWFNEESAVYRRLAACTMKIDESGGPLDMPRITIELTSDDHRALKLLSIVEGKTLGSVLREAIQGHLQHKGAHKLEVTVQQSNS